MGYANKRTSFGMKVTIATIGKFKDSHEKALFASYIKRIPWKIELKEMESKKALSGNALKELEADLLLGSINKDAYIIALDEKGANLSSQEFTEVIKLCQDNGRSKLAFIIGGADGLAGSIKHKAHLTISFSKLTWPHLLVRVMLAEQLYRSYTIIQGHPYHRV